jgi:hypothetical protein
MMRNSTRQECSEASTVQLDAPAPALRLEAPDQHPRLYTVATALLLSIPEAV